MRILVTADIHCGHPGKNKDCMWALETMYQYAKDNNIQKVIVLGDLFHNREQITVDVLNDVFSFFKRIHKEQDWIVFPGNHDIFLKNSWEINSLTPLDNYITVIDKITSFKIGSRNFVVLPFIHYESTYMKELKKLEEEYNEDTILLTHIGVNNAVNNSCFLIKYWSAVNFVDCKFNLVLTGHFHNYQVIDDKVCYPGSPIPFKFDEGGVPHGFLDLDVDELECDFVDIREVGENPPCDYLTIIDDMVDKIDEKTLNGNRIRVSLSKEYSKSQLDNIRDDLIDRGALSVQWMKNIDKEEVVNDNPDSIIEVNESVFTQWIKKKDLKEYDEDLLLELHDEISKEAEESYVAGNND